jgi:glutaminyl-peptide cyclotransferase
MARARASHLSLVLLAALFACANKTAAPLAAPHTAETLSVHVLRAFPHDPAAFTQGLVYFEGKIYESTGLVGSSSLRRVSLESGLVEVWRPIDSPFFAEGLARVGGNLVQLTWQNGLAFVWRLDTLQPVGEHSYDGEGWGLCDDGQRLVMSDGSESLTFRDRQTFATLGSVKVARDGQPVRNLNELECVQGAVYANIWMTDSIVRIDPSSGAVTGWIDASGLLTRDERARADVLNGIAYVPERDSFLITGKLWPRLFEVRFEQASAPPRP